MRFLGWILTLGGLFSTAAGLADRGDLNSIWPGLSDQIFLGWGDTVFEPNVVFFVGIAAAILGILFLIVGYSRKRR